jgi:DNA-directed RNA polymerase subunit alpha
MKDILLPNKISITPGSHENEGILTVEPCYMGYGTTVGNALRRVLLSSLPGAAVFAVKIKGVQHEFTPIKGVKEDALNLILNLKQLRLKCYSDDPVKLTVKASGSGALKAKDIDKNADVEIINGDLEIAHLTDKDSSLEMELYVNRGRGYVPIEERDRTEIEVGSIAVDSLYSPVINVGFKVENTRVGEITNYDKLILTVETDGTITPEEAIDQSVKIISDYFTVVATRGVPPAKESEPIIEAPKKEEKKPKKASKKKADKEEEEGKDAKTEKKTKKTTKKK